MLVEYTAKCDIHGNIRFHKIIIKQKILKKLQQNFYLYPKEDKNLCHCQKNTHTPRQTEIKQKTPKKYFEYGKSQQKHNMYVCMSVSIVVVTTNSIMPH